MDRPREPRRPPAFGAPRPQRPRTLRAARTWKVGATFVDAHGNLLPECIGVFVGPAFGSGTFEEHPRHPVPPAGPGAETE